MAEQPQSRLWFMRGLFLTLSFAIMFLLLLPLKTTPAQWASPDWLMALAFGWATRRPEYVPILSVAGVMLLADFLFQRPPGLYAALILAGSETLRSRALANREMPFLVEWASVAGIMIAIAVAYRVLLPVFFLPAPPFNLILIQLGLTIICYPIIVLVSHILFKVRRPAPGEIDALGHRL